MKLLKPSILLTTIFFMTACSKEEACLQSDWLGTYTGTESCSGDNKDVIVTITADGTNGIVLTTKSEFGEIEYPSIAPINCDFEYDSSDYGGAFPEISLTLDGALDGNTLTIIDVLRFEDYLSTCKITATRN